jgi:hypothetical protein
MPDEPLIRLFWRVLDQIDYWLMQPRLWMADVLCGSELETNAEERRQYDQERI